MKTHTEHLVQYARYHRDVRNIATHFVGIPMIVLAVTTLMSRASVDVAGHSVTLAMVTALASVVFYLRLNLFTGLLMTGLMAGSVAFGQWAAAQSTPLWLLLGVGGFVAGWVIQFIGHFYEGRKPAFVDDLIGLLVGPLFVLVEALFMLGLLRDLKADIERQAGPIRRGQAQAA